ncbi:uncharacterized protein LOC107044806 [Diachasma alloeum]|uniref:uncharacterized protein LOC107044806 n=1 Tax=Diachasma alloeum TaxID=454923 RepID=UPI0007381AA3|nr:uncharacterized protein LOC107044806 [Diachasma alloeum]
MVFDTTASNTGPISGACILLERLIGRDLLHLACRHHIFELLLKTAFEVSMGCTSGPDVQIFKRFQNEWENMDKTQYSPRVEDNTVKEALHCESADILAFAEEHLKDETIHRDYSEFLELVVIFLGGKLRGNRFRALGPIHHARWMAKAIYSLKICPFREQFRLNLSQISGLMNTCIFIVLLYQRVWFTASHIVTASNNYLNLLKRLAADAHCSSSVPSKVWKAVLEKFVKPLCYLPEELIALAFFNENVDLECKRNMCQAIKSRPALDNDRKRRRMRIDYLESMQKLSLDLLVTKHTIQFFNILKIDSSFLGSDPTTWETRDDFVAASKIVRSL